VNATGDTRHDRYGTASGSMMSYRDHGELEQFSLSVSDELAWCSRAVPGVTELTGCVIGQAKQLVDRFVCECYGRRGMMYLR